MDFLPLISNKILQDNYAKFHFNVQGASFNKLTQK